MTRKELLEINIQQANTENGGGGVSSDRWNLILLTSIAYSMADIADILAQKATQSIEGGSDANGQEAVSE